MEFKESKACCFTGHRPEKLEMPEEKVISWIDDEIHKAVEDGYEYFISGMQQGVDIWAAEIVLRMKADGAPVKLVAASAFRNMEKGWNQDWRDRYIIIMENADDVVFVCEAPSRWAFIKRDEWMVNHSSKVLAVYTGASGGTKKTIEYARKKNKKVIVIPTKI